jgi:hypothetical protein
VRATTAPTAVTTIPTVTGLAASVPAVTKCALESTKTTKLR